MASRKNHISGFTLIELLIVVAIIAILAAIAVPNFLEAQVRAKVSRSRADIRTVVTAVEAYAVDNNKYPIPRFIATQVIGPNDTAAQFVPGGLHAYNAGGGPVAGVTSPIAYITSSKLKDVFATGTFDDEHSDIYYQNMYVWTYPPGVDNAEGANGLILGTTPTNYFEIYGFYKIGSLGPDRDYSGGFDRYDPTNGTVSRGDLYRTQKLPEGGGL